MMTIGVYGKFRYEERNTTEWANDWLKQNIPGKGRDIC